MVSACGKLRLAVPDRLERLLTIEPADPLEDRELDLLEAAPRPVRVDHLGLIEPADRLRQGVVVRVSDAAHRGLDPSQSESIRKPDRQVLDATIPVMDQVLDVRQGMRRLLQGFEGEIETYVRSDNESRLERSAVKSRLPGPSRDRFHGASSRAAAASAGLMVAVGATVCRLYIYGIASFYFGNWNRIPPNVPPDCRGEGLDSSLVPPPRVPQGPPVRREQAREAPFVRWTDRARRRRNQPRPRPRS